METEKKSLSLSDAFEDAYSEFDKLMNSCPETSSPESQKRIRKAIEVLEELTKGVSAVDMFSKNEHYEEMNPHVLKFLLLPYMLGCLWQINTIEERRQICEISVIYFKDFLKRCREYELIEDKEVAEDAENETGEPRKIQKLTPEERRNRKIKKMKQNMDFDARVKICRNIMKAQGEETDATVVKQIYTNVVKKAINHTEDEIDSVSSEMQLISFAETLFKHGRVANAENKEPPPPPRQRLKPFIITKNEMQKKVYGAGYPSLPVMTVEELYQQRRATGEWGPAPPSGGFTNPEDTGEEAEAAANEALVEKDDETNIDRQRQNDEYKDDHRRGWGNRFNRS